MADKKLGLFTRSQQKVADRFEETDFSIGQEVFLLLDEILKPHGIPYREWLAWDGPHKVKVAPMSVVVDKNGEEAVVNKNPLRGH